MAPGDLETMAMRAVEMTVLGREDTRLLVATKRTLSGPRKIARLIAGLANAAGSRHAILLVGVHGDEVVGIDDGPDDDWWERIDEAFPGAVPTLDWRMIDIGGAPILAISPTLRGELIVATRRGRAIVPWFRGGQLHRTPSPGRVGAAARTADARASSGAARARAEVSGAWIARQVVDHREPVESFAGRLTIELGSVTGTIEDADCAVTLLAPGRSGSIELETQIHPTDDTIGVIRHDQGIEVRDAFTVWLYVAGAARSTTERSDPASIQLVVSVLLPGRAIPELRSLLLSPDPESPSRWIL